ncbi:type IV secretory system conjugative DNA transfer family protein [bacterium]|nr:type IV secretory system conjugative DNA transfer family protein [bacterium]
MTTFSLTFPRPDLAEDDFQKKETVSKRQRSIFQELCAVLPMKTSFTFCQHQKQVRTWLSVEELPGSLTGLLYSCYPQIQIERSEEGIIRGNEVNGTVAIRMQTEEGAERGSYENSEQKWRKLTTFLSALPEQVAISFEFALHERKKSFTKRAEELVQSIVSDGAMAPQLRNEEISLRILVQCNNDQLGRDTLAQIQKEFSYVFRAPDLLRAPVQGGRGRRSLRVSRELVGQWWEFLLYHQQVSSQRSSIELPPPVDLRYLTASESPLGVSEYRGRQLPFYLPDESRALHLFINGKRGVGKSDLLYTLMKSDIDRNVGCGILSTTDSVIDRVLDSIPSHRVSEVVFLDPTDENFPVGVNIFEKMPEAERMGATQGIIEAFRASYPEKWSDDLAHFLLYISLTLLGTPYTTILSIRRLIEEESYRKRVVEQLDQESVASFWKHGYPHWKERYRDSVIQPLLEILSEVTSSSLLTNCIGQPFNTIDFSKMIREKKIVLVRLSRERLGVRNVQFLGSLLISRFFQAARRESCKVAGGPLSPFYLYIDEFERFANSSYEQILSESRKAGLSLTLANEDMGKLSRSLKRVLFANIGNIVAFQSEESDARELVREFQSAVQYEDITSLPVRRFYARFLSDTETQEVFSGSLLESEVPDRLLAQECIEHSRDSFSLPKEKAEQVIKEWAELQ